MTERISRRTALQLLAAAPAFGAATRANKGLTPGLTQGQTGGQTLVRGSCGAKGWRGREQLQGGAA